MERVDARLMIPTISLPRSCAAKSRPSRSMRIQTRIAIMDIMPQADGHVLVIPRAPSRNLLDADPAIFKPL